MGKQMHFVLVYDLDTKEIWQDFATQDDAFPNGVFYNPNRQEWSFGKASDVQKAMLAQAAIDSLIRKYEAENQ